MDLVIATSNEGKFKEIVEILSDLGLKLLPLFRLGLGPLPEEVGLTLEENAARKAQAAARLTGKVALADDSGLEIEALGGAPGVYSARFGGEEAGDQVRNRKILELLGGIPLEQRGARFRCAVAIVEPEGRLHVTEGSCMGVIAFSPRGTHGFGYDPIFYLPERGCTMAELDPAVKNQISHRAEALRKSKTLLKGIMRARGELPRGA